MNSITNWQCIATIISLNFINAKKHNRMTKLQIIILKQKKIKIFGLQKQSRLRLRCDRGMRRWCVSLFKCALFKECRSVCCKLFREDEETRETCEVGDRGEGGVRWLNNVTGLGGKKRFLKSVEGRRSGC